MALFRVTVKTAKNSNGVQIDEEKNLMENLDKFIDIAEYLELGNLVQELQTVKKRSRQENVTLVLPLVGEFSSGKTTL